MKVSGQLYSPTALPSGKNPCTHRVGGCTGLNVCLDVPEKKNSLATIEIRMSGPPTRSLVTIRTTLSRLLLFRPVRITNVVPKQ